MLTFDIDRRNVGAPFGRAATRMRSLDVRYCRLRVTHNTDSVQGRFTVANNEDDDMTVVPIPGEDNEEERRRIRKSNDRDQAMERQGRQSRHNRGYDEAADGPAPPPEIERVVDE